MVIRPHQDAREGPSKRQTAVSSLSVPGPAQREITYDVTQAGRHKYGARRTEYAGRIYASQAEANRAAELAILLRAGEIRDLEYQPVFHLVVNGVKVGKYIADFSYYVPAKGFVVEDVKGVRTPTYRLKKKLVEALYGITITEVEA